MKSRAPNNPDRFVANMADAPDNLLGDIRMFRQILLNLLSNADKYTPDDGSIQVSAKIEDSGVTIVSVADSGVGIAEDDLEAIFEPFGQARNTVQVAHEGTGLGLPILKRLMELQGGELTLESTLGEGTTIHLRFPTPKQA